MLQTPQIALGQVHYGDKEGDPSQQSIVVTAASGYNGLVYFIVLLPGGGRER
jgi:hypothetical protein